jgi:hypothetical protein
MAHCRMYPPCRFQQLVGRPARDRGLRQTQSLFDPGLPYCHGSSAVVALTLKLLRLMIVLKPPSPSECYMKHTSLGK